MPVTQANREVSVKTALATDVLLFRAMRGEEQLGRLSQFRVQLLSTDGTLKIADVLGKPMSVVLELAGGDERHFHGIVTRFASTGASDGYAAYEATVHPWLWLLTRASNCRIFQEKSVPDIVKEVCDAYGGVVALSSGSLSGDYPPLPYCVQYRETDFNFVCRLLEAAGIYFYFTHDADKHTMVLADSYSAHQPIGGYGGLKFADLARGRGMREESVSSWSAGGEIQSSNYVLNDFDFEKAASSVSGGLVAKANIAAGFEQAAYEMFDYPGNYVLAADGNVLARARIETLHGQCEQIHAQTDARGLFPGGMFTLAEHPRDDQNRAYLITALSYSISSNDYTSGDSGGGLAVECSLTAIGKEFAYRPLPVMARPVVHGPQTAMVVGKAGEEIWTDQYGRVKVQFHWDRVGKEDENSSCWVRVAQGWAGKGWGAMSVPRIGMEVIVSFLEGDPDRPLVTGCVYNSDAMPPYTLPDDQTKSTIKSNSSKGGDGFNEIRFEDKKGEEEVFMHAERDFNRVVKNDDSLKVGFETADKGDQKIAIKNDQTLEVGNDQTITVTHDQLETIDNNQTVKIKVDQKVNAGATIVIEAGTSIELKVGGSSIKIEAAKITVKSPEIEIAADANAKVKAGAMMDLNAGGIMTIGGALVKIN
ncbi:MAG: type VI secretion system tip protein VgrG [Pseudomonadota bacterium]|nr:type VI secretion system tip protein VgrG [Pseudomonadota bacterium]